MYGRNALVNSYDLRSHGQISYGRYSSGPGPAMATATTLVNSYGLYSYGLGPAMGMARTLKHMTTCCHSQSTGMPVRARACVGTLRTARRSLNVCMRMCTDICMNYTHERKGPFYAMRTDRRRHEVCTNIRVTMREDVPAWQRCPPLSLGPHGEDQ